jgi:hypothetical protein
MISAGHSDPVGLPFRLMSAGVVVERPLDCL